MKKVLVLDTSILCVLLGVPGKETCGTDKDKWDKARVSAVIARETKRGTYFVLPLAAIIETGNHIAQVPGDRRVPLARALTELMKQAADERSPWAAFAHQAELWTAESLKALADDWIEKVAAKLSIGDATIITVAEYYARSGVRVEIWTGDGGLKAYEPLAPPPTPRRRH